MTRRPTHECDDQGVPTVWRAAIYLREPEPKESSEFGGVPSVDQQRMICRREAMGLNADVIGEFVDRRGCSPERPALSEVLRLAREDWWLIYLIVASWDRLAGDQQRVFHVGWRLGAAGTIVLSADREVAIPWLRKRRSS